MLRATEYALIVSEVESMFVISTYCIRPIGLATGPIGLEYEAHHRAVARFWFKSMNVRPGTTIKASESVREAHGP